MEKPPKSKKNMILKLLPKAAAAVVIFQNPPFSPGRDKKLAHKHHHNHKGFSGSLIPAEARVRKPNNETPQEVEPTSPKVSCIGQIKKNKCNRVQKQQYNLADGVPKPQKQKSFRNPFTRKSKKFDAAASSDAATKKTDEIKKMVPGLNQMRKFASGREGSLSNFDWKSVQITPEDHRKYYSDDDKTGLSDDEEDGEVIIPFSAPILVGRDRPDFALEPKKEINLWKRRTMTKPNPLKLNN